jgi:hypothetical protein
MGVSDCTCVLMRYAVEIEGDGYMHSMVMLKALVIKTLGYLGPSLETSEPLHPKNITNS